MKKISCIDSSTLEINNLSLNGLVGDRSLREYTNKFKNSEYYFLDTRSKKVLDLGASYGDFAHWCFQHDAHSVISVEANPHVYKFLSRNTYLLMLEKNYLALNFAISRNNYERFVFKTHGTGAGSLKSHSKLKRGFKNRRVKKIKGYNAFLLVNLYKPDIIKMDIQGEEYNALEDISSYIDEHRPELAIDYHYGFSKIEEIFSKLDYKVNILEKNGSVGLIHCIPNEKSNSSHENIKNSSSQNFFDDNDKSFEKSKTRINVNSNSNSLIFSVRQWDNTDLTINCIESILDSAENQQTSVLLFDDCSKDIYELVRLFSHFCDDERVFFFRSQSRLEFVESYNLCADISTYKGFDFMYYVNNDTHSFSKGIDVKTIELFDDPKLGIVGHKVFNKDGCIRHNKIKVKSGISIPVPTEGYAIRLSYFKFLGGFNQHLTRYREDLDLVNRFNTFGAKCYLDLNNSFVHIGNGSSSRQIFIPVFYKTRNFIWFDKLSTFNDFLNKIRTLTLNLFGRMRNYKGTRNPLIAFLLFIFSFFMGILSGAILRVLKPRPYRSARPYKSTNS